MPYVTGTGELIESEPWSLRYIVGVVGEALGVISLFFTSMLPFDAGDPRRNSNRQRSSGRRPPNIGGVRRFGLSTNFKLQEQPEPDGPVGLRLRHALPADECSVTCHNDAGLGKTLLPNARLADAAREISIPECYRKSNSFPF
ncbi:hypothetical protein ACTXT7_000582 [Hymenolepis weldensis]